MKTILVFSVMVMLCFSVPVAQVNDTMSRSVAVASVADNVSSSVMLIGAGRIREKNGTTFTIQSDDNNTYFAESEMSYVVGQYVLHSDPINGWVEILGLAE